MKQNINIFRKKLFIGILIVCMILIIGLSIMTGFYNAIMQTGFNPLALFIVGYAISFTGILASGLILWLDY